MTLSVKTFEKKPAVSCDEPLYFDLKGQDKMPTKEEVLKWYQSLEKTLQQIGLDMNNPADLMRIQCMSCSEDTTSPGMIDKFDADFSFAFMRKETNPDNSNFGQYEEDEPKFSEIDQNDTYPEIINERATALKNREDAWGKLSHARSRMKDSETIDSLKKEYQESKDKAQKAERKARKDLNDLFSVHDKWMVKNTTRFDAAKENDYAQIEHLYHLAKEGSLIITDPQNSASRQQILVNNKGESKLGPNVVDFHKKLYTYNDFTKNKLEDNEFAEFQKKYGVDIKNLNLDKVKSLPPKPATPVPAPKPGAKAWFLRIISFNQYKPEFTAYEKYQNDLSAAKKYEDDLKEARQHNEKIYQKIEDALDVQYREIYGADVEQPTKLSAMLLVYESSYFSLGSEENPEKGQYNTDFTRSNLNHERFFIDELKNNPKSFEPDGTRKEAESEEYWAKKNADDPEVKKADRKRAELELEGLRIDRSNDITRKAKQYQETFSQKHAKGEDYLASFPWAKIDMEKIFKNVGELFGKKAEYGAGIFANICTANQAYDANGEQRPTEQVLSNESVLNGISNFLLVGLRAGEVASNKELKDLAIMMRDQFSPEKVQTPPVERIVDSLSSVLLSATRTKAKEQLKPSEPKETLDNSLQEGIYTTVENPDDIQFRHNTDPAHQKPEVALSAVLLSKFAANSKSLDITKQIINKEGLDTSITTPEQRKEMLAFADNCAAVSKGHKYLQDDLKNKENVARAKQIREERAKQNTVRNPQT